MAGLAACRSGSPATGLGVGGLRGWGAWPGGCLFTWPASGPTVGRPASARGLKGRGRLGMAGQTARAG